MGHVIFYDEKFEWGSKRPHHQYASYWFDLDGYEKIQLVYHFGVEDLSPIKAEQLSEIRRWMQDNLDGEVIIRHNRESIGLYFQYTEDAAAFKLRWL